MYHVYKLHKVNLRLVIVRKIERGKNYGTVKSSHPCSRKRNPNEI